MQPGVRVSPSLMCADLCRLEDEVRRLEEVGADFLHFDLMDAHFTPNMPLGLEMIRRLRARTELEFDIHLMVQNNDLFVEWLLPIGVQMISVHAESALHLDRTLDAIRSAGVMAGVALNPATPLSALEYALERMDFLMLMTVNPGFAGQVIVPSAWRKIEDARRMLRDRGFVVPIEVDGNVSFANIPRMVAAGADILVAGSSSLFAPGATLKENMVRLREAAGDGMSDRCSR